MQSKKSAHPKQQGQSLVETLFVMFVLAVMCGVVASSMRWMQQKIQIQTAAEDLLNAVLTARTEALRREKRVTLCVAEPLQIQAKLSAAEFASSLPNRCHLGTGKTDNTAASWQQGWLMFVDDNSNGIWDPGEDLLQQHPALGSVVSATGNSTVTRFVSFGANGRSLVLNGGFQAGKITFCEHLTQASPGWLLIINAIGRPRLEKAEVPICL
jgi:type IV fimbrial biogenesis protein FimT